MDGESEAQQTLRMGPGAWEAQEQLIGEAGSSDLCGSLIVPGLDGSGPRRGAGSHFMG